MVRKKTSITNSDLEKLEKLCQEAKGRERFETLETIASSLPKLISEIRSLQSRLEVAEKALERISAYRGWSGDVADEALAKIKEGKE